MKEIKTDLEMYVGLMNEVKKRSLAVLTMLKKENSTAYPGTNIEFMCLQIRKMLELISLGSLVVNKSVFDEQKVKYEKFWHAERILNDIERINPDFYPKPVYEKPSSVIGIKNEIIDLKDGFLKRDEFVKIYEKCGKIMHADNPFGSKVDLKYYESQIMNWLDLIVRLLNTHVIRLKGGNNFYIIHMKEDRDDLVHGYDFGLVNKNIA